MKTRLLFSALGLWAASAVAQIPNHGFESWQPQGNYEVPTGWATMNGFS